MHINLSEILSVPGKVQDFQISIEMASFELEGIKYEFIHKNPLELTISNEGNKKAFIKGHTLVTLCIPCGRCLEEATYDFHIDIFKSVDFNETEDDRIKELDEINYIDGYEMDVDKLVYNEILIDFPMKVLCKNDCKGICNKCGTNLNQGDCNCDMQELDPRMSVIKDIFNNFKEV